MQYCSRLHIKVSSPKVWKKFENEDDASFDLAELAETERTSFVIDDWSSMEDELTGIVEALAETLGSDGIIIADTTNINVDPYNYCIFYLGDEVRTGQFTIYSEEKFPCNLKYLQLKLLPNDTEDLEDELLEAAEKDFKEIEKKIEDFKEFLFYEI